MILEKIAFETGVSSEVLAQVIRTASHRYKSYLIKKKSGGTRVISQPTPQVKYLQRWIVRNVIGLLPVHSAVTSYRDNMGIATNALMHAKQKYLLRIDLKDFFPSITAQDVDQLLRNRNDVLSTLSLDDFDRYLIVSLVCRYGSLTIGAPSSPAITNTILFDFDTRVSAYCASHSIAYSRYADDLCFSTDVPNVLSQALEFVKSDLHQQQSPKLIINDEKTIFTSKKRRRVVTGVVITPAGKLSVGRKKKRSLRTMIFRFCQGKLESAELDYLKGYLAYAQSVEPELIVRLRKKYGPEIIDKITSPTTSL